MELERNHSIESSFIETRGRVEDEFDVQLPGTNLVVSRKPPINELLHPIFREIMNLPPQAGVRQIIDVVVNMRHDNTATYDKASKTVRVSLENLDRNNVPIEYAFAHELGHGIIDDNTGNELKVIPHYIEEVFADMVANITTRKNDAMEEFSDEVRIRGGHLFDEYYYPDSNKPWRYTRDMGLLYFLYNKLPARDFWDMMHITMTSVEGDGFVAFFLKSMLLRNYKSQIIEGQERVQFIKENNKHRLEEYLKKKLGIQDIFDLSELASDWYTEEIKGLNGQT